MQVRNAFKYNKMNFKSDIKQHSAYSSLAEDDEFSERGSHMGLWWSLKPQRTDAKREANSP